MSDPQRDERHYGGRTPTRGPTVLVPRSANLKADAPEIRKSTSPTRKNHPFWMGAQDKTSSQRSTAFWMGAQDKSQRSTARRSSPEMYADNEEMPSRAMDLPRPRQQVRGMDAGRSQVRAGYSEKAHKVAAMVREKFMVDEDVEFVSRQGNNFAIYALALFWRHESGEETTAPRKTLLQLYNDNPVPDRHALERARAWVRQNDYALQEWHERAIRSATRFLPKRLLCSQGAPSYQRFEGRSSCRLAQRDRKSLGISSTAYDAKG